MIGEFDAARALTEMRAFLIDDVALSKPFQAAALTARVRQMLASGERAQVRL